MTASNVTEANTNIKRKMEIELKQGIPKASKDRPLNVEQTL